MSFLDILEVAIGLVFAWLLVSLAVMQTQEWIAGWLAIRADGLEEAIQGMLADPKRRRNFLGRTQEQWQKLRKRLGADIQLPQPPPLVQEFYQHPLITSLAQGGSKPSYIPADKFALALFDVVMTAGTEESVIQGAIERLERSVADLENLEVEFSPEQVRQFRKLLEHLVRLPDDKFPAAFEEFKQRYPVLAAELDNPPVVGEVGVAKTRTALNILYWRLGSSKLGINPQHIRVVQQALREVKDLDAVQSALTRLRQQYPDIGPVVDALEPVLEEFLEIKPTEDADEMLAQIMSGAAALAVSNPGLKRTLISLVGNAKAYATEGETAIAIARTNVETWFDDTMDRASGWYKRHRQVGAFVIGLVFAVLINVDSVNIGIHMWRDPALRQAVVAQAELYNLPAEGEAGPDEAEDLRDTFGELQSSLTELQIPIGWNFVAVEPNPGRENCKFLILGAPAEGQVQGIWFKEQCLQEQATRGWGILSKLIGLIVTAAAATFGAPFWFEILQKLIAIRSAGNVREPATETESQ